MQDDPRFRIQGLVSPPHGMPGLRFDVHIDAPSAYRALRYVLKTKRRLYPECRVAVTRWRLIEESTYD